MCFSACAASTASLDPEAYDISATVDVYFLRGAPRHIPAKLIARAAIHRTSSARI
jgi:hypothetical protein